MLNTNTSSSAMIETIVDTLTRRAELQANLFDSGQMDRWWSMIGIGPDFTLFEPFGGTASHGFTPTPEDLAALAANFRNGTCTLELQQSYATNDMVVLVYIERQTGEVHGLADQDWSLRVTQVFRRQGETWQLVHRHADPLVRPISLPVLSALAGGRALVQAQAQP
jgi:ketosteroid isomerase-like protein